jgi:SAM-dependent methyltransferase
MDRSALQTFYDVGTPVPFNSLLQLVNRQAIAPFFRERIRRRGKVLDAGSGRGDLARELGIRHGYFVDLSLEQVRRCRLNLGHDGFFVQADLEHLPFKAACFDQVICSNALHYTGLRGMKELLRVTRKKGGLLLSFLENSFCTGLGIRLGILWGVFPPWMVNLKLIDLAELFRLKLKVLQKESVIFFPPRFRSVPGLLLRGLILLELEK